MKGSHELPRLAQQRSDHDEPDPRANPRLAAQGHFRTLRLATPFQPRLDALMKTEEWYDWAGYRAPNSLWDEELEYFAIRSQAAVFDISPMVKYRIEGPDAEPFLNRVTLRDVSKLKPGRVHYTAWCDDEGHVLDDGTLFRLAGTGSACAARSGTCPGSATPPSASTCDRRGNGGNCRPGAARSDLVCGAARRRLCRRREAEAVRPCRVPARGRRGDDLAHRLYRRSRLRAVRRRPNGRCRFGTGCSRRALITASAPSAIAR